MQRFIEFYAEAIDLDTAKEKKMSRKYSGAYREESINSVFGDKDRIIYDYNVDYKKDFVNTMKNPDSGYSEVANFLESLGYNKPSMREYIDGKVTDGKQQMKIGRILNKNLDKQTSIMGSNDEMTPKFSYLFKTDPVRHIKHPDLAVVISRHPYDIYGMSTGRMWTSCMDLNKTGSEGNNCTYIPAEVEHGTLIAYLVPKSEVTEKGKVSIKQPISRILLKPMRNEEGELGYAISQTYGGSMDGFENFVEKWSADNFNSKVRNPEGFTLDPNVYEDPYESQSLGLADHSVAEKRKLENTLRKLKEEFVSHIPKHLKPNIQVTYFVDDEADNPNEVSSTVSIIFKDPEFIETLNVTKPVRVGGDDIANHSKMMQRYNVHWKMPSMDYFKGVSINPKLGIVKFVFSNVGEGTSIYDVEDMYQRILKLPAQTLKIV